MIEQDRQKSQVAEILIDKIRNGVTTTCVDFVAVESPLQINVLNKPVSITMRTPGDDVALALGFLFTEGLIGDYNVIASADMTDENTVNIVTEEGFSINADTMERNFYSTSSCGVCGKSSVEAIRVRSKYSPAESNISLSENILFSLQEKLLSVQSAFEMTGGLHACALFTPEGKYIYHSEDVGRHNALDKLIGHALMAGKLPLSNHILLLSGRASFELMQKASMAGIPVVAAVGAPSSLAVDLAIENGQTLVGFLKKSSYNIYAGPDRIEK